MYKLIKGISLFVLVLYCVIFFWKSDLGSPEECQETTCIESAFEYHAEGNNEQSMSPVIYESLSSDYPITMNYPETDIKITIDKVDTVKKIFYLSGLYEKELQKATDTREAIYERASIYLNMSKMLVLKTDPQGVVYYATPFMINNSGSGVFVYIGLFSYDNKTKESKHLDSELLGDRIGQEKITYIKDYLKIDFKGYSKGQAFSEYPDQKRVIFLRLNTDFSSFNIFKKMHNSWDKNGDGINDCESENSCDHTVDYSLPR
tara:strand:+ start:6204 stop:6986 length:783 start_codon:yes stop_codon:yes gene_type:complete